MIKTPPPPETTGYTYDELRLIVKAQHGAIEGLVGKVNACTSKLKEVECKFDELGQQHVVKEIKDFILTIDK
jgi:hypothetical protein